MKKFEFEYIDKLRIHELRDFAKKLGVSSPTTLKKEDLICKISTIIESRKENSRVVENQQEEVDFFGLLTSDNSDILSNFLSTADKKQVDNSEVLKKDIQESALVVPKRNMHDINSPYPTGDDLVNLTFTLHQNKAEYCDEDSIEVAGYLYLHSSGYGIIRTNNFIASENDVYMTSALIKKYQLKQGQLVVVRAKHIMKDKPRLAYEIVQVDNGIKYRNLKEYDEYTYNGLGTNLYLDEFKYEIKRGSRNYIEKMDIASAVELANDIARENSSYVKMVNIKALPEENFESNEKVKIVNAPFNIDAAELMNSIDLVIDSIKREVEEGKSSVLILYNFSEIIRAFNIACEGYLDFSKFNSKAINKISNILYLAKYIDKAKNCTLICIDKNGVSSDLRTIMDIEFLPLFNKRN